MATPRSSISVSRRATLLRAPALARPSHCNRFLIRCDRWATDFVPRVWFVPTHTSSVQVTANASLPVQFDFGPGQGDPDLYSNIGTTATGTYTPSGGLVQQGFWFAAPSEIGPYPSGAPAGTVSMSMTASMLQFDPAVASDTGNLWLASINPATTFSPIVLNPGQTAIINVTITPSGASGTLVQGHLYVCTLLTNLPPYGQQGGDELAALPYAYTIK